MWGVACVFISCSLFIHLGLGEAVSKTLRIRFVLFRCVKCLTFWSTLAYSLLIVKLPAEESVCLAFVCAYASLWMELLWGKLANIYEKVSNNMDAEEPASASAATGNEEDKTGKGKESSLS